MNILCTLADSSELGRLDYLSMGQQALMECLVAHCDEKSLRIFRDKKNYFKDISEWHGVICNSEGDVIGIHWTNSARRGLTGSLSFQWLPPTVQEISIEIRALGALNPLRGSLDFHAIPKCLRRLNIHSLQSSANTFEISGRFGDLPRSIEVLDVSGCLWNMAFCVTNIPNMLHSISIHDHAFGNLDLRCTSTALQNLSITGGTKQGTISFLGSPPSLTALNVRRNALVGSLSFRGLAPCLRSLLLDSNAFSGIIVFEDLPCSLEIFSIAQLYNAKCERIIFKAPLPGGLRRFAAHSIADAGTVDFLHFSKKTETINISQNQISGSVRIAHLISLEELNAANNLLEGSVEFKNLPEKLREIDLSSNTLAGTVDLSTLPKELRKLYLQKNNMSGSFVIGPLPTNLHTLNLSDNQFEMETLVVPVGAKLPRIDLRGSGVKKVMNTKGRTTKAHAEKVKL